jgi:Zn-dependent membrane protease YugP
MGMGVFWIGIGLVAMAALFALVTLPVEYNASHRAIQWLERSRSLDDAQVMQARIPLKWAARTYLVAALNAIGVLAYYLIIALSGRRN